MPLPGAESGSSAMALIPATELTLMTRAGSTLPLEAASSRGRVLMRKFSNAHISEGSQQSCGVRRGTILDENLLHDQIEYTLDIQRKEAVPSGCL